MAEVAILVPVLRRPDSVKPLLDSIFSNTPTPRVLFLADPDDHEELAAIREDGRGDLAITGGNYAYKINQGVKHTHEPFLLFGADDLRFHPGWFEAAKRKMVFPVGVVGTQDLGNSRVLEGKHSTHPLIARWYTTLGTLDGQDGLMHEGYDHNFCDTELVETAKARGAWDFAEDSIVEHLHPFWEKGDDDEVYRKGQANFRLDARRFRHRSQLWASP